METENLSVVAVEQSLTASQVKAQVNLIQDVMKKVMRDGEHFGRIPGCGDKPTLLKAGAEKLCSTFRFAPKYSEIPGCREDEKFISYKINCELIHIPTGAFVGAGVGTCNSQEKKYREMSVFENQATDEEKAIGKLVQKIAKSGKPYKAYIIPQNPWDLQNTIYKMACKRALIAATLNATAASDIFTQDIEDMDLPASKAAPIAEKEVYAQKATYEHSNGANHSASSSRCISEAQGKRLYAIYKAAGLRDDEVKNYLLDKYGVTQSKDIKLSDYEAIITWAQNGGKESLDADDVKEFFEVPNETL